jgi:hypothetical protein
VRQAARTDANHRELFDLAIALGGVVVDTHQVGGGCPDGFVWSRTTGWFPVEIKSEKGKLRASQMHLHQSVPVVVWRKRADVFASFGVSEWGPPNGSLRHSA